MKDLLEKVRVLQGPVDQDFVERVIARLGDIPSIKTLEAVVSHYKKQLKDIVTGDLLDWMNENDMDSFENENIKVIIRTFVSAKVNESQDAFKWLISNGYGDLIKDTLDFPKGEFNEDVRNSLDTLGVSYTQKSGIHPQSLKKVMSDRLKDGEDLPEEHDGITINYFDECQVKEK